MTAKSCRDCIHSRREQTGPHAFSHSCIMQQRDFPEAEHCGIYVPAPDWVKQCKSTGMGYAADED